jgi:hypothetical protein
VLFRSFSFDVRDIPAFVNENQPLVAEMIYAPVTVASGIDVIVGQKGDFKLNSLSNDIYLQANACGWTVSGSTNFGQETISVETLMLKEALCADTLTTTYMSQLMRAGSNPEELPFESFIVDAKVKKLALEIDKMFWQGDKASGVGNLSLVDGIVPFLDDAESSVYVASASGTTTISNVISKIDAIINAIPVEILDQPDLAIYAGSDVYRTYINALLKAQYPVDNESQTKPYGKSFMIPGYNVEIIMTPGLTNTGFMYASAKSNFVLGTDLTSDSENIEVWYSKDNDEYRLKTKFKIGVGAHFPQLIVHNNENITVA